MQILEEKGGVRRPRPSLRAPRPEGLAGVVGGRRGWEEPPPPFATAPYNFLQKHGSRVLRPAGRVPGAPRRRLLCGVPPGAGLDPLPSRGSGDQARSTGAARLLERGGWRERGGETRLMRGPLREKSPNRGSKADAWCRCSCVCPALGQKRWKRSVSGPSVLSGRAWETLPGAYLHLSCCRAFERASLRIS